MMDHTAATASTAASTHIAIHTTRWIRASDEPTPQTATRSPRFATIANRLTGKPKTIAQGLVNTREQDELGTQPKGEDLRLAEPTKRYVDTAIERDVTSAIEMRRTRVGGPLAVDHDPYVRFREPPLTRENPVLPTTFDSENSNRSKRGEDWPG